MILLTGGAGFIGSCFLKILNQNGIKDIVVVDNLRASEKWKNLVGKRFKEYYQKNQFLELFNTEKFTNYRFDTIIHLGACTDTTQIDMDYLIENNFHYSVRLAQYALDTNARFIYASSAATYGAGELGYDDNLVFELKPLNPYGFSKHLFDCWVYENALENTFVGLKFFNVFGPNEYHKKEMASMVYKAFYQVKNNGVVRLFKSNSPEYLDGEQRRDFVYVFDVVDIMWKIMNTDMAGIYNLGSGEARTWNELATSVFNAIGKEPNIEYVNMPDNLTEQYQNFTQAKMDKLFGKIGHYNFTLLEDAVSNYVVDFLNKKWQYF